MVWAWKHDPVAKKMRHSFIETLSSCYVRNGIDCTISVIDVDTRLHMRVDNFDLSNASIWSSLCFMPSKSNKKRVLGVLFGQWYISLPNRYTKWLLALLHPQQCWPDWTAVNVLFLGVVLSASGSGVSFVLNHYHWASITHIPPPHCREWEDWPCLRVKTKLNTEQSQHSTMHTSFVVTNLVDG